jgi:hypothetical protein
VRAVEFADLVHASPNGRGRWQARCPAHPDRSPSLAITEGDEGRVLVRCWVGCDTQAILAALGLTMRDLFSAEPADPTVIQLARTERLQREAVQQEHAATERRLATIVRRLNFAVPALGSKLAHAPANDALAEAFHAACDWLHVAESGFADA